MRLLFRLPPVKLDAFRTPSSARIQDVGGGTSDGCRKSLNRCGIPSTRRSKPSGIGVSAAAAPFGFIRSGSPGITFPNG